MRLTALEMCRVAEWLNKVKPGAAIDELKHQLEIHFGEIQWDSACGFGEGAIYAKIGNVEGCSNGDCTAEEALMDLANKLLDKEISKTIDENECDWI